MFEYLRQGRRGSMEMGRRGSMEKGRRGSMESGRRNRRGSMESTRGNRRGSMESIRGNRRGSKESTRGNRRGSKESSRRGSVETETCLVSVDVLNCTQPIIGFYMISCRVVFLFIFFAWLQLIAKVTSPQTKEIERRGSMSKANRRSSTESARSSRNPSTPGSDPSGRRIQLLLIQPAGQVLQLSHMIYVYN